jgi:hypothetical protein
MPRACDATGLPCGPSRSLLLKTRKAIIVRDATGLPRGISPPRISTPYLHPTFGCLPESNAAKTSPACKSIELLLNLLDERLLGEVS